MVGWKNELDAHISVYPVSTTSYLPVVLSLPGTPVTVHIAIYLPTSGQESEFADQLTSLRNTVQKLREDYPVSLIYLRGDCNVNVNNKSRSHMFEDFLNDLKLRRVFFEHKTYHHFMGEGLFDSRIDVILQPSEADLSEKIERIFCSKLYPEVDSHHDVILSSLVLPKSEVTCEDDSLVTAPQVPNLRHKTIWSEECIEDYQVLVSPQLKKLREDWLFLVQTHLSPSS